MKRKVIITCAVTGGSEYGKNSIYVPKTPRHIAEEAVAAARAGAASVHIHVRDPDTGAPSMKFDHYKEVVERIRGKKTAEVRALLAEEAYDEVVHRDNLVIG